MYHQQYQQENQPWGGHQSIDESEDAEVQGIFQAGVSGSSKKTLVTGEEYDDVVHRFGGLMGQDNMYVPDPMAFIETPRKSQLNANVAAFTPENQNMTQQQMWQQQGGNVYADRVRHRTPGPTGAGNNNAMAGSSINNNNNNNNANIATGGMGGHPSGLMGPSPPNPFRYGLGGFKMGLSPPTFPNMQQQHDASQNQDFDESQFFANNPYGGTMAYMQDPAQIQQANAWYEHLPGGLGGVSSSNNNNTSYQFSDDSKIPSDDYGDQNVTFNPASFMGDDNNMANYGTAASGMVGGHHSLAAIPNSFDFQDTTNRNGFNYGMNQPNPASFNNNNNNMNQQRGGYRNAPPGYGGYSNTIFDQQQQQQQQQQQYDVKGMGEGNQMMRPPVNYAQAAAGSLNRQYPQPQDKKNQPYDSKQNNNPYYHDNRQPLAYANHRVGEPNYAQVTQQHLPPVAANQQQAMQQQQQLQRSPLQKPQHPGMMKPPPHHQRHRSSMEEEEERKEKRDSISSASSSNVKRNRKIANSIDSSRSSASSSIDSHTTKNSKDSQANKKRQELEETPHTRTVFKEFYKNFRAKEKESYDDAFKYARECLESKEVPDRIHWKIYLEMADLAKRENKFQEARRLYELVNQTQPYAHQGWLEYAKMEEECGRMHHCRMILYQGLEYCNFAEQLLTKAIKHEERLQNLDMARALLSRLRSLSVDKTWRTILEGALLEARAGNLVVARKVFKYLMRHVPWYGPIYYEATKFEEKNEEFERAIAIVERGLKEIPRYGPLWFNAFRLYEKTEMDQAIKDTIYKNNGKPVPKPRILAENVKGVNLLDMFGVEESEFQVVPVTSKLQRTRGALQRAMNCISKELIWKVHFEAAQVAERGGGKDALENARNAYVQSILRCPVNLRWKVWLSGARTELAWDNIDKARKLLSRALVDVPAKSKAQVFLECSRLEEYTGNIDEARKVLKRARVETRHEWKVFLESVMLEVRNGKREDAIRAAEDALGVHYGTGRLWAILVQLKHVHGPDAQRLIFREALKQVPKSGEVWCEGARIYMNPLSPHFDLDTAHRYLQFAIQFTPQFGDSFLCSLRWELLVANFGSLLCDPSWLVDKNSTVLTDFNIEDEQQFRERMINYDISDLELKCVNADPNYGSLWFHCKRGPFDTARQVLRTAKNLLIAELTKFRMIYYEAIIDSMKRKLESVSKPKRTHARTTPALATGENAWIDRISPEAKEYLNFSTGLLSVNWLQEHVDLLVDSERRKFLFGSDQIVP